jgi:hypothetical protein
MLRDAWFGGYGVDERFLRERLARLRAETQQRYWEWRQANYLARQAWLRGQSPTERAAWAARRRDGWIMAGLAALGAIAWWRGH